MIDVVRAWYVRACCVLCGCVLSVLNRSDVRNLCCSCLRSLER
jgi:hypothetical protein